jgi:hypothetical protein
MADCIGRDCILGISQSRSSNYFTVCQYLLQSVPDVTYEEKQKLNFAFEQLKTEALQLNCRGQIIPCQTYWRSNLWIQRWRCIINSRFQMHGT